MEQQPNGAPSDQPIERTPGAAAGDTAESDRSGLIYCGLCGALNPASSHFCASCGTTLVDAFHGTEGLRIYQRPDAAARLVEIVPSGSEMDLLPDAGAPVDFARVQLPDGRIGYVRLPELEALTSRAAATGGQRVPDINTNARGCVSSGAALAAVGLLLVIGALGLVLLATTEAASSGILLAIFCLIVVPFLLLTIGLYLYARGHEDRIAAEEDEAAVSSLDSLRSTAGTGLISAMARTPALRATPLPVRGRGERDAGVRCWVVGARGACHAPLPGLLVPSGSGGVRGGPTTIAGAVGATEGTALRAVGLGAARRRRQ